VTGTQPNHHAVAAGVDGLDLTDLDPEDATAKCQGMRPERSSSW
jgi:hypothetical protein